MFVRWKDCCRNDRCYVCVEHTQENDFRCYHSSDSHTDMKTLGRRFPHLQTHTLTWRKRHIFVLGPSPSKRCPGSFLAIFAGISENQWKNLMLIKFIPRTSKEQWFFALEVSLMWFHVQGRLKCLMQHSRAWWLFAGRKTRHYSVTRNF